MFANRSVRERERGGGAMTNLVTKNQSFFIILNMYIYIMYDKELTRELFASCLGDRGSISVQIIPKTQKLYLIAPCLTHSIIRYESRVSGTIHGNE